MNDRTITDGNARTYDNLILPDLNGYIAQNDNKIS